jgi:hypothetical protein
MIRFLHVATLIVVSLSLAGCGESLATVSGKVTLNDKPLTGGTVILVSEDGKKTEQVPIQADGKYSSDKVPLGNVKVAVWPPPVFKKAALPPGYKAPNLPPGAPNAGVYADRPDEESFDIPKTLQDPKTSNLTVTVKGGSQTFDIPLKSAK